MGSRAFIAGLTSRRWTVIAAIAIVTLFAAAAISRIDFDNSIESWFLETDRTLTVYDRFTDTFKADQIVIVGVFADDVFSPDVLDILDTITTKASNLAFVERVQSLTNSAVADRVGGFSEANFDAEVLASPLLRASLLSPGMDATAVVVHYSRDGNTFRQKRQFVDALRGILRDATADRSVDYAITGGPVLAEAGQTRNGGDMRTLVPAMILVIIALAYGIFRRISLTFLPLTVVGIAVLWAYGLMGIAGWPMSMISVILIPLILAVGVGQSIHIMARYRLELRRGRAHAEAIQRSVTRLLKPCFYTSLTTVVGLLSLLVSDLGPVHEFAVTAAFGVFAAFLLSVTLLPVMLTMLRPGDGLDASLAGGAVSKLLNGLQHTSERRSGAVVVLTILVALAFLWLSTRVESGLDPMSWIRHEDPIRVDTERIDTAFGGALSLEFLLTSGQGMLAEPANLRRMEEFQIWLVANTTVGYASSISDLVREAARIARDDGESANELPRSKVVTNGLLESINRSGEQHAWLTDDRNMARIAARIPLMSAQQIVDEIPAIEEKLAEIFDDAAIEVDLTGHAVLSGAMQAHMIDSQLYSFSVALGVVSLIMIILLQSVPLGLVAMVPNLMPIMIGLGSMALFDIALNPATVMIAAVALGIVVDDTVHLMTAFEREMRSEGAVAPAIKAMTLDVGRPVLVTSVLLAAGFSLLILGSFLPTRQIGGLIALIAVAALVTDLLFLPALLHRLPAGFVRKFLQSAETSSSSD